MRTNLRQGMPAASTAAYIGFIGQIEAVVPAKRANSAASKTHAHD